MGDTQGRDDIRGGPASNARAAEAASQQETSPLSKTGNNAQILVVEDDDELREQILLPTLRAAGYVAAGCGSAIEMYRRLLSQGYAAIVLDVGLPDEDGFSVVKNLRQLGFTAGITLLTGRGSDRDRAKGLNDGADAYLTKPVDPEVLIATMGSVLRRVSSGAKQPLARPGAWSVGAGGWELLTPDGTQIRLSHGERALILLLADSPGEVVAREALIAQLTREVEDFDPHRLEMLLHRLRKKVQAQSGQALPLTTVRGAGYVLSF
ncbi:TPA: response regulator transcription factor [Pseudomonas aeruginosa]|nr:response regulator transcription factor [Pseudomonas aeruginosa]